VYFVNSGSEANDFAIFLARLHTGNFDIISFRNSYHGMSSLAMALTAQSSWRNNLPMPAGFHHVSNTLKFHAYFSLVQIHSLPAAFHHPQCCGMLIVSTAGSSNWSFILDSELG